MWGMTAMYNTGDMLHGLLRERLGVGIKDGCQCREWIDRMNQWGPDGSRKYLTQIVNALLAEADRRQWQIDGRPLLTKAAKIGTNIPGGMIFARAWVRALVTEAINRSEQSEKPQVDVRRDDRTVTNP